MAGHIQCVICLDTIHLEDYRTARCWTDPTGITCAAHALCLIRVGETDPDLRWEDTNAGPGPASRQAPGRP